MFEYWSGNSQALYTIIGLVCGHDETSKSTENSTLSQYLSEQEWLLEKQNAPSGLYPGDKEYNKFVKYFWTLVARS